MFFAKILSIFHCIAQKLGLVEAPELLLSEKEWKEVKEKSNLRQDSALPCVICKEDFGLQQQVSIHQLSYNYLFGNVCHLKCCSFLSMFEPLPTSRPLDIFIFSIDHAVIVQKT